MSNLNKVQPFLFQTAQMNSDQTRRSITPRTVKHGITFSPSITDINTTQSKEVDIQPPKIRNFDMRFNARQLSEELQYLQQN
jgi:hypothetical protein